MFYHLHHKKKCNKYVNSKNIYVIPCIDLFIIYPPFGIFDALEIHELFVFGKG